MTWNTYNPFLEQLAQRLGVDPSELGAIPTLGNQLSIPPNLTGSSTDQTGPMGNAGPASPGAPTPPPPFPGPAPMPPQPAPQPAPSAAMPQGPMTTPPFVPPAQQQGQAGGFSMHNPNFLASLGAILASTVGGRYGGYAGQGILNANNQAQQLKRDEEQKQYLRGQDADQKNYLRKQDEDQKVQNALSKMADMQGLDDDHVAAVARSLQVPDARVADVVKGYQAIQSSRPKANIGYMDLTTGAVYTPDKMPPSAQNNVVPLNIDDPKEVSKARLEVAKMNQKGDLSKQTPEDKIAGLEKRSIKVDPEEVKQLYGITPTKPETPEKQHIILNGELSEMKTTDTGTQVMDPITNQWRTRTTKDKIVSIPQQTTNVVVGQREDAQRTQEESALRKEYDRTRKTFDDVQGIYNRTLDLSRPHEDGSPPNAADDFALLHNYIRMQSPGTRVTLALLKSSQYDTRDLGQDIDAAVQKLRGGSVLTPEQRAKFVNAARSIYKGQERQMQQTNDQYKTRAAAKGFDPSNVVRDLNSTEEIQSGPKAGEKAVSKSGKPMTYDGTRWNYDAQ